MVKTLKPIGNSLGLIIEKSILELLHIDRNTPIEVTTDGTCLFLRPLDSGDHRARVLASAERMAEIHADTFEKLAR